MRPYFLEDHLGLVRRANSKIGDGSDLGTHHTQVVPVADLWLPYSVDPQLVLRFATFGFAGGAEPLGRGHRIGNGILPTSLTAASELC